MSRRFDDTGSVLDVEEVYLKPHVEDKAKVSMPATCGMFQTIIQSCYVIKKTPVVAIAPLLLIMILIPVAVWGIITASAQAEETLRSQASIVVQQLQQILLAQVDNDNQPFLFMALLAQVQPLWSAFVPATALLLPFTLAAGSTPLLAAPQGIFENVSPTVPRLLSCSHNCLGADLMGDFNPPPNASDTSMQSQFLPNGLYVRAVFFIPPPSDFNKGSLELMGYNRTTPLNCPSCRDPVSGRVFWGFVGAVLTGSPLLGPGDPLALQLVARGYVYTANFMLASGVIVDKAGSSQEPSNPVCSTASLQGGSFSLCVSPVKGWAILWRWPLVVAVSVAIILLALLVLSLQLSRLHNRSLLESIIPLAVLKAMDQDANGYHGQHSVHDLGMEANTVAGNILLILDEYVAGRVAPATIVLTVRRALAKRADIYTHTNLKGDLLQRNLDADVTNALMAQFGNSESGSGSWRMEDCVDGDGVADRSVDSSDSMRSVTVYDTLGGALQMLLSSTRDQFDPAGSVKPGSMTTRGSATVGQHGDSPLRLLPSKQNCPEVSLWAPSIKHVMYSTKSATSGKQAGDSSPAKGYPRPGSAFLQESVGHLHVEGDTPPSYSQMQQMQEVCVGMRSADTSISASIPLEAVINMIAQPEAPILSKVEDLLSEASTSWQFDAFALDKASQGRPLSTLAFFLMHQTGLVTKFKLPGAQLARFLVAVEDGYQDNSYHNKRHAASVLQSLHVLLTRGEMVPNYADPATMLACYFAAAVHDYEHVGLTNDFLVATSSPLAMRYNDRTPLENHHVSAAFMLLQQPNCAFLKHLPKSDRDKLRKLVIELVLGTDMKQHFAIISAFTAVHPPRASQPSTSSIQCDSRQPSMSIPLQRNSWVATDQIHAGDHEHTSRMQDTHHQQRIPISDTERILSLQMALKCADLGHLAQDREVHLKWVAGLEHEFFSQGDREKDLGLVVSPLFDRAKPGVTKSQVGFFDFCALPLFAAFSRAFPAARPMLSATRQNYAYWKELQPAV